KQEGGKEGKRRGDQKEVHRVDAGARERGGGRGLRPPQTPRGGAPPAAAAGDEQVVPVDVAASQYRVDAGHQVVIVVAGIGMVDEVAELLTVASAAARVGVQDHVAGRRIELNVNRETRAVAGKGPTVDLQDQRVLLLRIEIGRLGDPTVELSPVPGRLEPDLLDLREGPVAQQAGVALSQPPRLLPAARD